MVAILVLVGLSSGSCVVGCLFELLRCWSTNFVGGWSPVVSFLEGDWVVGPVVEALLTVEELTSLGRYFVGASVLFCAVLWYCSIRGTKRIGQAFDL